VKKSVEKAGEAKRLKPRQKKNQKTTTNGEDEKDRRVGLTLVRGGILRGTGGKQEGRGEFKRPPNHANCGRAVNNGKNISGLRERTKKKKKVEGGEKGRDHAHR